jgi:hypothetical protein
MFYSQRNPKWASVKLGNSKLTIGSDGCLVTAINNIYPELGTPIDINNKILNAGGFTANGEILPTIADKALGLKWKGHTTNPISICIAKVMMGKFGHYITYNPKDKTILDPWDLNVVWKPNNYKIIFYSVWEKVPSATPTVPPTSQNTSSNTEMNEAIEWGKKEPLPLITQFGDKPKTPTEITLMFYRFWKKYIK